MTMYGKIMRAVVIVLLAFIGIAYAIEGVYSYDKIGAKVDPGQVHTDHAIWTTLDATTSAEGAATALVAGERTYQLVAAAIIAAAGNDDSISVFDVPRGWNAIRIRALSTTATDDIDYAIYVGTLGDGNEHSAGTSADCNLQYIGLAEFVTGTQVSTLSGSVMCHQVVFTSASSWIKTVNVSNPGSNYVAEIQFDLMGADLLVAVPVTVDNDCVLIGKGF